jgi:uncharacterized protein YdeI (YjbR/CyaY-like superfamily)
LSLAASIIAVVDLTRATINACYTYGNRVKSASRDIERIINQLEILQTLLADIQKLAGNATKNSVPLPTLDKLNVPDALHRYTAELASLKLRLTRLGRARRLQALLWPLKEGDVKKTLEYLKDFQQLLSSILNIDQLYVSADSL